MMKLSIPQELLEKYPKIKEAKYLLLDFDDGVGPYSQLGNACSIGSHFKLVLLDEELPEVFDKQIDSNVGPVYIKGYSTMYLDQNMRIVRNPSYGNFELRSDNTLLDSNLEIESLVNENA